MRIGSAVALFGLLTLSTKASIAQDAFGAAAQPEEPSQSPTTPPTTPTPSPATAEAWKPTVVWSEQRVSSQVKTGALAFGIGYVTASLIPLLAHVDGPSKHPAEKNLALIPIVGPAIYWFTALNRLSERRAYEKAHPCQSDQAFGCAFHDTAGIDTFFHGFIMAPYVIVSTGAQAVGAVFLLEAAYHSNDPSSSSSSSAVSTTKATTTKKASVTVSPIPGGLSVHGTF